MVLAAFLALQICFLFSGELWRYGGFHFSCLLTLQKNSEISHELVVESDDSAPMSEVHSRTQMDIIEELREEEEEQE